MEKLGYLVIAAGFLAASFFTVRDPETVAWESFVPALAVGLVGVAMTWIARRKTARREDKLSADIETLGASLERITANAAQLDADKDSINVYDLRQRLEDTFFDDVEAFVEARESMAHSFSLQAYANIMSHFAAGERHLNRVWSTSTDGYVDEAHDYIAKALEQFQEAKSAFETLKG